LRSIFEKPALAELALFIEEELIREIAQYTEEEAKNLLKEDRVCLPSKASPGQV